MPQYSTMCHSVVPLFFLVYVNDRNKASHVLDPIMFVDNTNLFYSHQNIKTLFRTVNCELEKIYERFRAKKLSLNVTKTNYILFHQDTLPLKIPELKIGNSIIKRKSSVKFLGVMLDEQISCKDHTKTIEKKISQKYWFIMSLKTIS